MYCLLYLLCVVSALVYMKQLNMLAMGTFCVCVCNQGDNGSTRPALNLDSTRAPIRPTNHSLASLLCEYTKYCLSA